MKLAGIIAEYNPFHNGHKYQIEQTRLHGATHVCAVMSGDFVQRGELAIFDKYTRAEAALRNGVDLVVEMPVRYSLAASNRFAKAGVAILNNISCDMISFGSECGDLDILENIARIAADTVISARFSEILSKGYSYPKALHLAIYEIYGESTAQILSSPNNVLALEYISAINVLQVNMEKFTVKRIGCTHDGIALKSKIDENFQSASYIRNHLQPTDNVAVEALCDIAQYIPISALECYKSSYKENTAPLFPDKLETAILYKLRTMGKSDFLRLQDVNEGLENRLYAAARKCTNTEEFCHAVKSRRYTMARIRRIMLSAFLGIEKQDKLPSYIHVLGANKNGLEILARCKKSGKSVIPKFSDLYENARKYDLDMLNLLNQDCRATDIAALAYMNPHPCGMDFTQKLIILP